MPLYDLRCDAGHEEERFVPLTDFPTPLKCGCGAPTHRIIRPLRVMSDIQPYQAVGTDIATGKPPVITSRSQHREYLKRNGYVEVGNEKPKSTAPYTPDKNEIGRQIKHVIDQKGLRL